MLLTGMMTQQQQQQQSAIIFVVQPRHTKQRTYRLPYGEARIGSNNVFKVLLLGGMRGDRLSYWVDLSI